ncbi:hypothetical protein [Pelagerythrobacter rhizovicinus]|uniref:Uncharacterized protein n=1 Tax=Pelagerythrobacter rhizovicinus TaxID=2268576 RepID=A0A4Q2KIB2_9SPHN|nr:hypothetical protein [Pelagerythrobacter rhizovicinus]RXZ64069.1 hypothetical protein ETX26_09025 [Pelagerythrobacter rhizovicinus]
MKFRNLVAATAALSLATSPAIAQSAASAERVSAPVEGESKLAGGGSGVILAILAAAAVIAGIVIAVDGGDDDPVSV